MAKVISIDNRLIGAEHPPYIIAEISANHNGDINQAYKIIDHAAKAGADAVKIQTYKADTITLKSDKPDFQISDGLWAGQTLYELYESAHTPWEWHEALFKYAKNRNITIFSSPFDFTAVDLLESLGAPAYKIASFEAVDIPLIKYVASKKKPMIISTGMANYEEISEALAAARSGGCQDIILLHCVSGYPAPASDYNLITLLDIAKKLNVPVGLSDHTINNTTAITSVALGACLIEKHVTLDRNGGGPDDSFSLEPKDLRELCKNARTAWESLGTVNYRRKSSEEVNIKFRRSLYFVKALKAGDIISENDIRSVRPGYGLKPKHWDDVIGSKVLRDVAKNSPVTLKDFLGT